MNIEEMFHELFFFYPNCTSPSKIESWSLNRGPQSKCWVFSVRMTAPATLLFVQTEIIIKKWEKYEKSQDNIERYSTRSRKHTKHRHRDDIPKQGAVIVLIAFPYLTKTEFPIRLLSLPLSLTINQLQTKYQGA